MIDRATQEVLEQIPAAVIRAELMAAHRVQIARLAAGYDDEVSLEAEAGALLEAETANEIHGLHEMVKGYLEALAQKSG